MADRPISTRNTGGRIQEDDPRWNPLTMGNNMQGPHGNRRNYTPAPAPRRPDPAPKPKKTVAPTKKPGAPLASAAKPLTPLDQLVAMYAQQQAELRAQQLGQQQAATQFSQQMLQYLNQQPGAIDALYQHAVDQTNAFGQASADQFRAANPNAQVQADLGAIGAGADQQAKVGGELNSIYGTGGATLYTTGAAIPGSELAANQASAGTYANSLPGIQALQARQLFAQLLANQAKDTSALTADKTKALYDAQTTGGGAAAGKAIVRSLANGQLQAFDPYNGTPLGKPYGPTKPLSSSTASSKPIVRNFTDGTSRQYNPQTGGWDVVTTKPPGKGGSSGGRGGAGSTPTGRPISFSAASDYAQNMTANTNTLWKVRKRGSGYEAFDTRKPKSGAAGGATGTGGTNPSGGKLYAQGTAYDVLNTLSLKSQGTAISKWKVLAQNIAINSFRGNEEKGLKQTSYQAALAFAMDKGIPLDIAQQALNKLWKKPGVAMPWEKPGSGRPAKPIQQRNPQQTGKGKAATAAYQVQQQASGVISFAGHQVGKPYVFGSGPDFKSFDCSDLIQAAYKQVGISLPRTTYGQIKAGKPVSLQNIQPGDLVFPSKGHVVLYIGGGQVIAAPHTGALVQYQNLSDFGNPVAIRRVLPDGANFV